MQTAAWCSYQRCVLHTCMDVLLTPSPPVGVERIVDIVTRFLKARKLPLFGLEQILRGLITQTSYDGFNECQLVIEAVIENIPLKQVESCCCGSACYGCGVQACA